ncbi:MAG: OB-fold domain-containing protein [Euryarchaeota archaeon]|nr:OB-fold domain-containing protein [Euryarchaeota archaeon]
MAGVASFGIAYPSFEVHVDEKRRGKTRRSALRRLVTAFDEDENTLAVDAVRAVLAHTRLSPREMACVFVASTARKPRPSAFGEAFSETTVLDVLELTGVPVVRFPDTPIGAAKTLLAAATRSGDEDRPMLVLATHDASRSLSGGALAAAAIVTRTGTCDLSLPTGFKGRSVSRALGVVDMGAAGFIAELMDAVAAVRSDRFTLAPSGSKRPVLGVGRAADVPGAFRFEPKTTPIPQESFDRLRAIGVETGHIHDKPMGAFVSQATWLAGSRARYHLEGAVCGSCKAVNFPPNETCNECGAGQMVTLRLSGRGTTYSLTRIGRGGAPAEFAMQEALSGPYWVAIVELDEGPKVVSQLACGFGGEPTVGTRVQAAFRRIYKQDGSSRYGLKFVPSVP